MKITLLTGKIFDLEQEFDFPLSVLSTWRNRRLTLRIDSRERKVVLGVPKLCSPAKARAFVLEHQEWIEQHLLALTPLEDFKDGDEISLFGRLIRLCHCADSTRAARLEADVLYIGGDKFFFHRRVKDYIRRTARTEFEKRTKVLAERIGCVVRRVSVKDTKSRWGSCSGLNNINYSWRLALAPEDVIDYLMAHEVSHLRHRDHSAAFWQCVADLCPRATVGKVWLKRHGNELYRYR